MLDYFNSALPNFGGNLFGDDSESKEFTTFVNALSDDQCCIFVTTVNAAFIIETETPEE